jgi:hypothetical protein
MQSTDFYTAIELSNGKYIGKIYRKSNNQHVYTTSEYTSQAKMLEETRRWFSIQNTTSEPVTNISYSEPKTITNTVQYQTTNFPKSTPRRCCGRR